MLPSVSGRVPGVLLPEEPAAKHEPSAGREQNPTEGKERPHAHPGVVEAIIIRASPARTRVGRFRLGWSGLGRIRIGVRIGVRIAWVRVTRVRIAWVRGRLCGGALEAGPARV